ncbi:MAG TPA: DNA primase [Bryobacteraceae bacterium]|nr:DNA primase [Bryobacteraceae bacterium]
MEFKEQLRAQVDIVRVASDYVRLRRAGKSYTGLCPFHNEKTPSFSISQEHQYFRCFGCDAKGDVFSFVQMIEGLTFWEALKKLADQHGIALPKQSLASDEETRLRAQLYEMHEIAFDHFRKNLAAPAGEGVRAYIAGRGVAAATAEKFGLGLADGSGRALLRLLDQRGFKPEQLEASGLVGRREDGSFYERFRNRLIFPIQNESGKVIAFGGRALNPDEKAKYLNSPETKIYKKSHVLYNLNRAKETSMKLDRIVLVEGYMDVIGAWQAGVTEVVASCGTALTTEQIRAMKRHSQNLHLNFDPDSAGASATERSIKLLLDENVRIRIVELEDGLDPDEYCKKYGAETYQQRIAGAKTYFYWLADRARARFNMREPQGRVDAFQFLLPSIQSLNDKLERVAVANDLASYLGVPPGLVLDHFRKVAADRVERTPAPKQDPARATDRILLPLLIKDAEARSRVLDALRDLAAMRQLPTWPIFEALLMMHEGGETISFNTLHTRLNSAQQDILAALVLDAGSGPESTIEDGIDCIEVLRRNDRDTVVRGLKSRIKSAEREGRLHDALALMRELESAETATTLGQSRQKTSGSLL